MSFVYRVLYIPEPDPHLEQQRSQPSIHLLLPIFEKSTRCWIRDQGFGFQFLQQEYWGFSQWIEAKRENYESQQDPEVCIHLGDQVDLSRWRQRELHCLRHGH